MNILGDFAGGGAAMSAIGVLMALHERHTSGKGQSIDAAFLDGAAYLTTFIHKLSSAGMWGEPGSNNLDGGAPYYDVYQCQDGKHVSVGSIEPQFYSILLSKLGLSEDPTFEEQNNEEMWPAMKKVDKSISLQVAR